MSEYPARIEFEVQSPADRRALDQLLDVWDARRGLPVALKQAMDRCIGQLSDVPLTDVGAQLIAEASLCRPTVEVPRHMIPTPGEVAALVYAFRELAGEDADDLAAVLVLNKLELLAQLRES